MDLGRVFGRFDGSSVAFGRVLTVGIPVIIRNVKMRITSSG